MSRWAILRTSGGQTLPLMRSLREAGLEAWTPARVIRRVLQRGRPGERHVEIDVPILPTFVFASEAQLSQLDDAVSGQVSGRGSVHPAFSIFRHGGKIPLIADAEIAGLRGEEDREAATLQAMRDAETYAEAEAIRIAAIKSESARRRATKESERARLNALRSMPFTLDPGTLVDVAEMPALVGVAGVFEATNGSYALVRFGSLSWKIDGWRLSPSDTNTPALQGLAA